MNVHRGSMGDLCTAMSEVGQGLKAMAEALVPQKDDNSSENRGITGRMGITKTIGHGMQSMSDGFVAMARGIVDMGGGLHDMAGGLHALAGSFNELKLAIQPIARSINHVAAGLTAVGLTLIYANWGVGSFLLGNMVFLSSLALFHWLLRIV